MAMSPHAKKYELNIEMPVSLPAATASQLIGQVRRGSSLKQLCVTACSSRMRWGSVLVNFSCSARWLCVAALEQTARSFVSCSSKLPTTTNDALVYYKGCLTKHRRGLMFKWIT